MNKLISVLTALVIIAFLVTSCKSKQKVTEITGANLPATNTVSTAVTPAVQTIQPQIVENEVTRNESFTLTDGDATAMNLKYHVVVGSFKNQANAKGLKATLVNEGNKALVVMNDQGWYRVLIGSYNEYSQAKSYITRIKNRFADAWVLVQK
jgi:cell division protein FtsN